MHAMDLQMCYQYPWDIYKLYQNTAKVAIPFPTWVFIDLVFLIEKYDRKKREWQNEIRLNREKSVMCNESV